MVSLGAEFMPGQSLDDYSNSVDGMKTVKRYVQEIRFYESKAQVWHEKNRRILRRYKDDRSPREQKTPRYNILWSNIQTLLPALYSRRPKPDIERRFRDKDDIGRYSSMVLERSVSFFLEDVFDTAVKQAVFDRLLVGRGTVWVRYEPHFKDLEVNENEEVAEDGYELTDNITTYNDGGGDSSDEYTDDDADQIENESVCYDYVHYEDFGHNFGRTWDEVSICWRKVYLTRKELCERFGDEIGNDINLDYNPKDLKDNKYDEVVKKAVIYEIWNKAEKTVIWIHKEYEQGPLDQIEDPLRLTDFWPFPRPLFATLANDTCIPVPDYIEYQDQANELDEITSRIGAITKCIKVAGVYDASAPAIGRLLSEGIENQLVPVDQWAMLAQKGGLQGIMELMPMENILQTLLGLYEARDKVKSDLYEITGIADILRGASDASETATAQQIKSQFGTLRLSAHQDDVQRFVRELVKIGAEIIANHFSLETIRKISGIELMTQADKQLVQMRMSILQRYQQMQPQQPQLAQSVQKPPLISPQLPPQMPSLPNYLQNMDQEDLQEAMSNPSWEDVYTLLQDEISLAYKIDIETDSTIKFDQDAERDARVQFLEATGNFLQSAMANQNPDLAPLLAKLLMFGVRGFKVGKELESAFELAISKLEKDARNPQQKPNPEMMKIQGEMQLRQQEMQADAQLQQMKSQAEEKRLQLQTQVDAHQAQVDAELARLKITLEQQLRASEEQSKMNIARLEAETKIAVAEIQSKAQLQNTALQAFASGNGAPQPDMPNMNDLIQTVVAQLQAGFNGMTQVMAKPKMVVRDDNGNIVGVQ
jgi:hypothetical protein